jgi:hypothetical protein
MSVPEISPTEFVSRRDRGEHLTLLDVREDWELGVARLPDVVHIPMGQVAVSKSQGSCNKTVSMRSISPAGFWPGHAISMQPFRRIDAS